MARTINYLFAKQNLHLISRNIKESHKCESDIPNTKLLLNGHTHVGLVSRQDMFLQKPHKSKLHKSNTKFQSEHCISWGLGIDLILHT